MVTIFCSVEREVKEMIKIIEHGTIEKKRCEKCGCLFSYEKEDVEYNTHCDFGEFSYKYVICPQCKEEIQLGGTK